MIFHPFFWLREDLCKKRKHGIDEDRHQIENSKFETYTVDIFTTMGEYKAVKHVNDKNIYLITVYDKSFRQVTKGASFWSHNALSITNSVSWQ